MDLKGQDSVPDTVHQVLCWVDPNKDSSWRSLGAKRVKVWHTHTTTPTHPPHTHTHTHTPSQTDGVHSKDNTRTDSPESLSEGVKLLKAGCLVKAIDALKMDQAIIFCRTKLDCDNIEEYLISLGGGQSAKFRVQ